MSEKQAPPTAAELVTIWVDAYAAGSLVDNDKRLRNAARAVADRLGVPLAPEEPERPGWFMREEATARPPGESDDLVVYDLEGGRAINLYDLGVRPLLPQVRRDHAALVEASNRAVRALRELESGNYCRALRILRDGDS